MSNVAHVAGTFLIQAHGSFLNGAGLASGENGNVTVPKTLRDGTQSVPYVSAQAWKRWLRNTLIEETGWKPSELRASGESAKGSTNKISGELDPVEFAEDDLFGYMQAQKGQGKKGTAEIEEGAEEEDADDEKTGARKTKAILRASPFSASLLVSTRRKNWKGSDEGFVHLKEGTPLPYTTEFYTTHLQGVFCLAHGRVGVFVNEGDRIELAEAKVNEYKRSGKIVPVGGRSSAYEIKDAATVRGERSGALLKALSVLRGGAKQAAFGTDVAPKCLITAGLSCGNPIFNDLFQDNEDGTPPTLKVACLKEVVADYADRLVTPVFIGIRQDYLGNDAEVRTLKEGIKLGESGSAVEVKIGTPRQAAEWMAAAL